MSEQEQTATKEDNNEPKGLFQRFWQKLDNTVKQKAEQQASQSCCGGSSDKKDGGGKCC